MSTHYKYKLLCSTRKLKEVGLTNEDMAPFSLTSVLLTQEHVILTSSLVPRHGGGGRKSAWYTQFVHTRNYSKGHVAELGLCANMTINGSRE